jgi:serine/threonine protein kinase
MATNKHPPFHNADVKDILRDLETTQRQKVEIEQKLADHVAKTIEAKFAPSLIDQLKKLEDEETELVRIEVNLRERLVETLQQARREELRKAGGMDITDHSITSQSSSSLTSRHSHLGKTGTGDLRSWRAANPFLGGNPSASSSVAQPSESDAAFSESFFSLNLDRKEIEIKQGLVLGKGAYGSVYEGRLRGHKVAVKVIAPKWASREEMETILGEFKNECAVMRKLAHPNVVMLMGVCLDTAMKDPELIMVTQLMERGSIHSLLHSDPSKRVEFKRRMRFARDTALAMNAMHLSHPPILHLDLKPHNILVDRNWTAKVADFGLSRVLLADKNRGQAGSPVYMAPEILAQKPYEAKADVFSFGIVLCELVTNQVPYQQEKLATLEEVYQHVVIDRKRPTLPPKCPPQLVSLIQQCLEQDPSKRPTFQQILDSHALDDEVIVDVTISDTNALGRTFWKQSFKKDDEILETVSWKLFASSLFNFCLYSFDDPLPFDDQLPVKALKLVFARENVVTLEWFSKALEWFGPFLQDPKFIDSITKTVSIKGFWGDISKDQAMQLLVGKKEGTYLIRYSAEAPGFLAITVLQTGECAIKHYRIQHKAGLGFVLGKTEYSSLSTLIKSNKQELGLEYPLSGPFTAMLKAHATPVQSVYHQVLIGDEGPKKKDKKAPKKGHK